MDSSTLNLEAIAMVLDRTDRTKSEGELLLRDLMLELIKHIGSLEERVEAIDDSREAFAEHDLPRLEARIETLEEGH